MEKIDNKSAAGIILIAAGILLEYLPEGLPVGPIEFFRGLAMGIGITLLIAGFIRNKKKE